MIYLCTLQQELFGNDVYQIITVEESLAKVEKNMKR